jgi:hypothetical protein
MRSVNTYFEGRMAKSKKAKFGRSKEKVRLLYQALRYKQAPYMQKKSVVPKPPNNKNKSAELLKFMSG